MPTLDENNLSKPPVTLLESVKQSIALLAPLAERVSTYKWTGSDDDQYWEFFKRSIIKRQFEALNAIIHLTENKQGHFGVTFLRPAYEEMLWSKYLEGHKGVAHRIAWLLSRREIGDTVEAQNQFLGARTMQELGFTQRRVKQMKSAFGPSMAELRAIGKTLGWRNEQPPGAAALARWTKKEKEYRFIYHATSRYVHFSTHELGRRVWGHRGNVTIGSDRFSSYWSEFALYWGFRIYLDVCIVYSDLWLDDDVPAIEELIPWIKAIILFLL